MASAGPKLPLWAKMHNMTCPGWLLNIGLIKKIEPGCRAVGKLLTGKKG